ncbi:MAG: S9 family peptidase [Ignavibacteria bacterium]|nr:S9 family peptidase [Ignavibacteria bacterium]
MKKLSVVLLFVFINISFAQQTPLIDREIFFGDPEISAAQISPNGKYITFVKPFNNVRNIWVKERNQKFDEARPITADTKRPVTSYFWSHDSKYILFVQDQGGNENFRVYAVNPMEKGDPVPTARDLTPMENVRAIIIDVPKNNPHEILVGLNDRNPQLHDVYKLNLISGEITLVRKNDENIAGWATDLDGNLRLGVRLMSDGGTEILKLDGENLVQIYSVNNEETASPIQFTPDGKNFYMITNKGARDKTEFSIFNLETGDVKLIEKDPLDEVDFAGAVFSDVTNELLATYYLGDKVRIYFKNDEFKKAYEKMKSLLPDGEIGFTSMTADENVWLVSVSRDVDPGSVYLFDRVAGKTELLYRSRPNLPSEHLATMKPMRIKVRDGLEIPGYLTLPKGVDSKKFPLVMFIHGGPWARDRWGYSSYPQFLANRGYAVFQPNFRGSTGYGKKFLNAGNKQWGTGSMQHDITDVVNYLVKEGIADPKKVAIAGGSYGGYATLAGLAFTPDLYACGFDIVGPSNIITLLNSIPPYWAPLKKMFAVRVGDMENPDELKMLESQSPLNFAKNIKAPLYVVQGANDPRVKKAESDQIVVALRELERNVEYMVAPDEGHGFAGLENRLAMVVAMENFLAKYLSGRVQKDVSEKIQKRLNEITVDIKTVELPKKKETSELKILESFDGSKIKEENSKYKMTVEARGQTIPMGVSSELIKTTLNGKNVYRAIDVTSGMMGGADTLYVDVETLLPIQRNVKQGPAVVNVFFEKGKVVGNIIAGPQNIPIDVKLNQAVVTDGSGIGLLIESLNLRDNFTAQFNLFELQTAHAKKMKLKVISSEKIKVPAGEFDCYKIEINPVEGTDGASVVWVKKSDQKMVRLQMSLGGQMAGATITMELE